ncbi:AAA family ATPase [Pseudomonas atacamensis]|uniref:AAA family ATPase n=1 Tax=Pseudomonas atacamensis TaxID=2565368 RepID=UPI001C3E490B|nr:AAA family ATPase [Pseudomonas atacamensis]QXH73825.1 AAA family ATPase [Pseudomonas atacamensis]
MLLSHRFHGRDLDLCPGYQKGSNKNQFTAVVGKNGSGKSRLLSELVRKSLTHSSFLLKPDGSLPEIIALSTSPFDKFLLPDSKEFLQGYHYLGLRGLYSSNLSLSFMTRIIGGLLKALHGSPERLKTVLNTLDYLEYHEEFEVRFSTTASAADFKNPDRIIGKVIEDGQWGKGGRSRTQHSTKFNEELYNSEGIQQLSEGIDYFRNRISAKNFSLFISNEGILTPEGNTIDIDKISVLLEYDLIKLRDLSLHKKGMDSSYRVSDASSGEQCVLMAVLGIASRISDDAFICIDEPEICLHPEWQERYIKHLMEAFDDFERCQFIIATHSPQIISQLSDSNCYVLDLQTGKTYASTEFNKRSADYQLAKLFKAPGFSNEYLLREVVSVLSIISAGKKLDSQKLSIIKTILALKPQFSIDDPVLALLGLVEDGLEALRHD